jgi:hypothetical protein
MWQSITGTPESMPDLHPFPPTLATDILTHSNRHLGTLAQSSFSLLTTSINHILQEHTIDHGTSAYDR